MFIKKLIIGLLSFYFYNTSKTRSEEQKPQVEINYSIEKRRRKQRLYKNKKWKKRANFKARVYKLTGSQPKDHRFSNQRKLRRMFRNL